MVGLRCGVGRRASARRIDDICIHYIHKRSLLQSTDGTPSKNSAINNFDALRQKRAENVEIVVAGALRTAWACGPRVSIMFRAFSVSRMDLEPTEFSLHPLLSIAPSISTARVTAVEEAQQLVEGVFPGNIPTTISPETINVGCFVFGDHTCGSMEHRHPPRSITITSQEAIKKNVQGTNGSCLEVVHILDPIICCNHMSRGQRFGLN